MVICFRNRIVLSTKIDDDAYVYVVSLDSTGNIQATDAGFIAAGGTKQIIEYANTEFIGDEDE